MYYGPINMPGGLLQYLMTGLSHKVVMIIPILQVRQQVKKKGKWLAHN